MKRLLTICAFALAGLAALAITIAFVACVWDLWNQNRSRVFRGVVSDCETGEPIAGANIELWQQTILTWTRVYKFNGTSDAQGWFEIPYDVGDNVNVRTSKEGYILSDDYSSSSPVRIGLIKEAPNEADLWRKGAPRFSQSCKRAFECNSSSCGPLPPLVSPAP